MAIGMGVKDGFLFEIGRTLGGWLMSAIVFILIIIFILIVTIIKNI